MGQFLGIDQPWRLPYHRRRKEGETVKTLNITLPKDLNEQPLAIRQAVITQLQEAMGLPKVTNVVTKGTADERNMWSRSDDPLLGDAEDDFYDALVDPAIARMADVFATLGLSLEDVDMEKAFTDEFQAYEGDLLLKGKNKKKPKRDLLKELIEASRKKRKAFMQYLQDMNPFTKAELKKLDNMLKSPLPKYANIAEDFMVRAGLIGKIRNEAERGNFSTMGILVDRFPETIQAATRDHTVLTVREQEQKASEGKKVDVLPLTPQETRAVEHAEQSAANKVQEVNDRQMHGIRQVVLRAQKERWTPPKLAQELYDLFGEQNRDWRRVAITELAMASNDAYLSGLDEGEQVVGMGAANACPHCVRLVIGKEFTVTHELPKETYEHEEKYVWAGKSNFGRRVASYVACVPMHPNCRCRWHRLSRFYKMEEGKHTMKETWEMIQEERLARGMGLDPKLPVPYSMR
jgi:hypothetical protein